MEESILLSIKEMIGTTKDDEAFDTDIITHINSVFMILRQMGVGPEKAFRITGPDEIWTDFIPEEDENYEGVKTYMYLKTRLVFDPPSSATIMQSIKEAINEFEWRLNWEFETN